MIVVKTGTGLAAETAPLHEFPERLRRREAIPTVVLRKGRRRVERRIEACQIERRYRPHFVSVHHARDRIDVGISVEMLAVFVRFWVATTPALPEPAAQAARAKAGERYDQFVVALGRRLAKGPKLRQEISEDSNDSMGEEGRARSE